MSDIVEKTASSLAIVETKPQRPGGCVGIFFQLFDWNRRFAKKKLFSKKLLPPVRLKQASKKFGGDEKQPKLRLIADENSGGFPSAKKSNAEQKHEMRAPSLVARLMGLESIPATPKEKTKKIRFDEKDKRVDNVSGYTREELNVEKGGINKHELVRPQKLQKTTSICDRRSMTRFGAETLPFKNVLSKSRKHHHPKLPSPLKSPRNFSRTKNSSKLIGAATRILEPGLQTSRSKCALTYSKGNTVFEEKTELLSGQVKVCDNEFGSDAPKGQPSCRICGNILENMDSKPSYGDKPLIFASPFSRCVGPSCQESERINPQKDVPLSLSSNHRNQSQHLMFRTRDTFPPFSKLNRVPSNKVSTTSVINERKNFVLGNQSLSGKFEPEKRIADRQIDSTPPGRKRRPANISRQGESSGFISTNVKKQTYGCPRAMYGKELGYNQSNRSGLPYLRERTVRGATYEVAKRKVQNNSSCDDGLCKSSLSENGTRDRVEKPLPLSGDALGALLEQKLKELNCQGEDIAGSAPKKSTATILQELISALTSEIPFQQDKPMPTYDGESHVHNHSHLCNSASSTNSQANAMAVKLSNDQSLESEHLSPGSVLEAYFSNESCLSTSLDDSPGYKMLNESIDCSYHGPRSPNPNSELLDSANSINSAKTSKELVINILDDVSKTLANFGLKESELDHAKKLLLNAEMADFPIKHLLVDELETLASVLWMNFGCSLGIEDGREVNHLKAFTFDSIIEYLDLRFEMYPKVGSKVLTKSPFYINSSNMLILEIVREVRRWEELSRFVHDELIEREMSLSLGKWTQFENETFETGIEISRDVFQILVDEIIRDFW
ncbi:hypothetical protein BUALT_Bualt11G0056200 [Buddleja alternifolia]|uniref:DUF4378 domain-containing protein n=1 Tax=Buddleja alternifolia TaxID=168488 RepID=A0AAV6WTK1_9LAMI|nr:hypothetical protein BUALT_Bualt11G0056200 [Buddleja alternifolia]